MKSLYDYEDYKLFLSDWLEFKDLKKTDLAKKLGVQSSFLSQVLNGVKNLTLEQAHKFCESSNFDFDKSDYFLTLVQIKKHDSQEIVDHFRLQLKEKRDKYQDYEKKLDPKTYNDENFKTYCSRWYYGAIHTLLFPHNTEDINSLSEKLKISEHLVATAIDDLLSFGYIEEINDHYQVCKNKEFLVLKPGADLTDYHTTWRIKILKELENYTDKTQTSSTNLIYVSDDLALKIRDLILEANNKAFSLAQGNRSQGQGLYALTTDFFRVDNV